MRRGMLAAVVLALSACVERDIDPIDAVSEPAVLTASDSLAAARLTCESLIKGRLTSPTEAAFADWQMKREPTQGAFVGRGEVVAPNPFDVPITTRFVCMLAGDPGDMRGQVYLRNENAEMYAEIVRVFDLE